MKASQTSLGYNAAGSVPSGRSCPWHPQLPTGCNCHLPPVCWVERWPARWPAVGFETAELQRDCQELLLALQDCWTLPNQGVCLVELIVISVQPSFWKTIHDNSMRSWFSNVFWVQPSCLKTIHDNSMGSWFTNINWVQPSFFQDHSWQFHGILIYQCYLVSTFMFFDDLWQFRGILIYQCLIFVGFPFQVPSAYFLTDAFLALDRRLRGAC